MLNNKQLIHVFQRTEQVVSDWNASAEPMIHWKGGMRKCLSEDVFNALEELSSLAGTPSDDVHEGTRRLVMYVDEFARCWVAYTDQSQSGADVNPAGSPELWSAYAAIRDNLNPPTFRQPEPIEQLAMREKVPAWQIAKIYGWEDVSWVQDELDSPGSHYDPKTWVHPSQVSLDKELADKWAKRKPVDVPTVNLPGSESSSPSIAPESLETLIQQRVPVEQIARMKQISVSEVEQQAAMMGVVLTGARFVRPSTAAGIVQERLADDKQREDEFERQQRAKMSESSQPDEKTKASAVKRVKELRKSGKSPAEMQEILRGEFPSLDVSQLA